jgi:hypothetical protein
MQGLVLLGLVTLAIGGRRREILMLLVIPSYYLLSHSGLSTEYRYILTIHYFLFIFGAVTFYLLGAVGFRAIRMISRSPSNSPESSIAAASDGIG